MLDDAVLAHPLLLPVGLDVMLAKHPWNPQANDTPVVYSSTPGHSIFINGNSRVEQRTRLVGDTIEFKPYPATATDLDAMNALVGTFATVYVMYKGAGRQGSVLVGKKNNESDTYTLRLLHPPRAEPAVDSEPKMAWADME